MKKGLITLTIIIGTILSAPIVKAEDLELEYYIGYFNGGIFDQNDTYETYENWYNENKTIITNLRNDIVEYYEENYQEEYPYYNIELSANLSEGYKEIYMKMRIYENVPRLKMNQYSGLCWSEPQKNCNSQEYLWIETEYEIETTTYITPQVSTTGNFDPFYYAFQNNTVYYDHFLYETNFNIIYDEDSYYNNITITDFRNNGDLSFSKGEIINIPVEDISNADYTTINLDNYEYVLLSLKNYIQNEAFQTNLQVQGQIGITPIYNYGQTSKDSITGVKVQDRCNINYNNYTNYPFYILQQDLQNNVIYAVKECSTGSSFKFDNRIFNITYITQENKDNPTITINGKTYNVIPYEDLPSTATKNEQENYIPGESGSANDTGGLDNAIKNAQQKMSEIWNTITYFTDFINQIFSALPDEIETILISAFTIMIIIGLIKIFIS